MLAAATQRPPEEIYRDIRAGAESGWDFSSRWFADSRTLASIDTTEIIPVDLNALMFGLENAIRAGCERAGDPDCAEDYAKRAAARRAAVDRYLWDPSRGVYLDYRWTMKQRSDEVTAATLYPLFTRLASEAQAPLVAKAVEAELLKPGGIVATTLDTGQQWDAPNGWAPLQWIAVEGLTSFGQTRLAETIACRWMANVSRVYRQTGKLVEKYDVIATDRARRRRRISDAGRLWLDQRRDPQADGALSGRRRPCERRTMSRRPRRIAPPGPPHVLGFARQILNLPDPSPRTYTPPAASHSEVRAGPEVWAGVGAAPAIGAARAIAVPA